MRAVRGEPPTWVDDDGELRGVAPHSLPIADDLADELAAWAAEYDRGLERDEGAFEDDGRCVTVRLSSALGDDVAVAYQGLHTPLPEPATILRVLGPPDEDRRGDCDP